jgi:cation-transporting ATPase 13A3/4/5
MITITGLALITAVMVLFQIQWVTEVMQLVYIPLSFRVFILFFAGLNLVFALVCESYLFPIISRWIGEWWNSRKARQERRHRQQQQVFAPPPQERIQQSAFGYGSQELTDPAAVQGDGTREDLTANAATTSGRVDLYGSAPANSADVSVKKKAGKKSSVKIYKMVEDEMMGL